MDGIDDRRTLGRIEAWQAVLDRTLGVVAEPTEDGSEQGLKHLPHAAQLERRLLQRQLRPPRGGASGAHSGGAASAGRRLGRRGLLRAGAARGLAKQVPLVLDDHSAL